MVILEYQMQVPENKFYVLSFTIYWRGGHAGHVPEWFEHIFITSTFRVSIWVLIAAFAEMFEIVIHVL